MPNFNKEKKNYPWWLQALYLTLRPGKALEEIIKLSIFNLLRENKIRRVATMIALWRSIRLSRPISFPSVQERHVRVIRGKAIVIHLEFSLSFDADFILHDILINKSRRYRLAPRLYSKGTKLKGKNKSDSTVVHSVNISSWPLRRALTFALCLEGVTNTISS